MAAGPAAGAVPTAAAPVKRGRGGWLGLPLSESERRERRGETKPGWY